MAELKFSITNDHIKLERLSVAPVSDSINHLYASFDFDSAWDGCVKTAIFSGSGKVYHVILPDDNRCVIPWEVLTGARFAVSAFGTKGDFRITATELAIPLDKAGLKCAQTPSEPSDSAYTQLLQLLSWAVVNRAALEKFAEGSTDVPNMINIRDGVTLAQELAAKANKTALEAKADKSYNSGFIGGTGAKLNGAGGSATGWNAKSGAGAAAGKDASANAGAAAGSGAKTKDGGAAGYSAESVYGGAVGWCATTGDGFAGGKNAKCEAWEGGVYKKLDAIQLGEGTNQDEGTAQFYTYKMMRKDGTIPPERLNGDFYTKTETDTKIASAASDTVKYSDYPVHRFSVGNLMDKIDVLVPMIGLYEDHRFAPELTVQNKTSAPSSEVVPYGNTIQRYGEVSAMTIMMDGPYGAGDMYCGMVQFTSPAVPAEISVSGTPMFGVDCADGVFTPQANKRYTLKFVWDGVGYFGEVIGYSI